LLFGYFLSHNVQHGDAIEKRVYRVTEFVKMLSNQQLKQVGRHGRLRRHVTALQKGIHIPIIKVSQCGCDRISTLTVEPRSQVGCELTFPFTSESGIFISSAESHSNKWICVALGTQARADHSQMLTVTTFQRTQLRPSAMCWEEVGCMSRFTYYSPGRPAV
jgi:hypothetical protein